MDMTRSLSTGSSQAACYTTRRLVVKSLSPRQEENTTQVYHNVGDVLVQYPSASYAFDPEIYKAEEELKAILFDALMSLKNVESVRYELITRYLFSRL